MIGYDKTKREKIIQLYESGTECFSDYNFQDADLHDVNLSGIEACNANFNRANLWSWPRRRPTALAVGRWHNTDLSNSRLIDTKFNYANLVQTNFCNANLYGAILYGARLYNTNLQNTELRGTYLEYSNLKYIRFCFGKLEAIAIKDQIQLGREIHSTEWWLHNCIDYCKKEGYSCEEIKYYQNAIKMCIDYFCNI